MNKELKTTYDVDSDGNITTEEIEKVKLMIENINNDEKSDAQRRMTWAGVVGMVIYPFLIIYCSEMNYKESVSVLGDMASTYFVSIAGIVATFFGSEAYKKVKQQEK